MKLALSLLMIAGPAFAAGRHPDLERLAHVAGAGVEATGLVDMIDKLNYRAHDEGLVLVALPPHVERGWSQELQTLLAKSGIVHAQVRMYADVTPGRLSGSNVVSIVVSKDENALVYGKVHKILADSDLQWLAGKVWEIRIEGNTYAIRNKIPYAGREMTTVQAGQALSFIRETKIAAYSRPSGVAPFEGAYTYRFVGKSELGRLLGPNRYVMHEVVGPNGNGSKYYAVWQGPVAQGL
ncbi:MAG: hypothetical protein HY078_06635 [Elusimicrobia bacterium]|nr:hypothetical protein [Elusimicrobiota bacterium]